MSCSLKSLPTLPDLCHLKSLLFPDLPVPGEEQDYTEDDHRWSWDDDVANESPLGKQLQGNASETTTSSSWMDKCITTISPDGSLFVIAHGQRILCLQRRQASPWQVSSCKTLDGFSHFEKITSISLIPLLSQLKTNDGGIDWTALLVGTTHGILRVFTAENGCPLIIQKFCEEPLKGIRCSSFYPHSLTGQKRSVDQLAQLDDIVLHFDNNNMVAVIEGFAFYQTLRSTRSHLAKLSHDEDAVKYVLDLKISLQARKWILDSPSTVVGSLSNEHVIRDVSSGGEILSTTFDQMVAASFHGPGARPKKADSSATQFVTTGDNPFLGFYRTIQVEQPSLLNNVAQAVVSKAKNFLPIFSSKSEGSSKVNNNVPVKLLECLGLYDQHRQGLSIIFTRDKSLAALSDDFGRVCLVDAVHWIVVRMWKGYRDAQCSFTCVPEDSKTLDCRKSHCLVIYAPRRGVLEIWRLELGPRLASFVVGKTCKLFHESHSAFGMSNRTFERDCFSNEPQTFLLDFLSGKVFQVDVPFVCTLTDETSCLTRDKHFVKEFKDALRSGDRVRQRIPMNQIDSIAAKREILSLSLESGVCDGEFVAEEYIHIVLKKAGDDPNTGLGIDHKLFLQSCVRVRQLVNLYRFLSSKQEFNMTLYDFHQSHPSDIDDFASSMGWSAVDVAKCLSLFSLRHSVVSGTTTPSVRTLLPFQDFVSCFKIETTQVMKTDDDEMMLLSNIPVDINWKQDSPSSGATPDLLARFMFEMIFDENTDSESKELFKSLDESCVCPKSLMQLLIISWLSIPDISENWCNWGKISFALKTVGLQLSETSDDDQSLPPSWRAACYHVVYSKNIPAALIATFVIKTVTGDQLKVIQKKDKRLSESSKNEEDEDEEWETLQVDKERLNIVTKQMEDIFLLDLLLTSHPGFCYENQSLAHLVNSDSGVVSEVVSKWAVSLNLDINEAFRNETEVEEAMETSSSPSPLTQVVETTEPTMEAVLMDTSNRSMSTSETREETVRELLLHVKRCFPNSLNREVILINSCWESLSLWMKNATTDSAEQNLLTKSLSFLKSLSSPRFKHNLSCLIWKTFLSKQLQLLSLLTEKMGKIPKDRILRKELSLGEDSLESFVSFSYNVLEVILENVHEESVISVNLVPDDWWRQREDRRPPLVTLASTVNTSNPDVVLSHLHLVQVLVWMTTFQLKGVKPISMFHSVTRHVLFSEFSSKFTTPDLRDKDVDEQRLSFLEKVIASIAQSIPPVTTDRDGDDNKHKPDLLLTPSRMFSQANKWFGSVLTLSREWDLDVDVLRRRYICELYTNRCDSLAEEMGSSVRDKSCLASDLLPIACQRVLMEGCKSLLSLPPPVSKWMQSLNVSGRVIQAPASSTRTLMQFIQIHLPDGSTALSHLTTLIQQL